MYIFFARRDVRKLTCLTVSRGSYRTTSRNRLVNLWYMTNIPVLGSEEMLVNKLGVDVLLLMLYADFVSASLFNQIIMFTMT